MGLDYNDPLVGEELAKIQPMTFEEVEEELLLSGVPAPPTMNEMDIKLMLVELRLRNTGAMSDKAEEARPTTFSSKFEEALCCCWLRGRRSRRIATQADKQVGREGKSGGAVADTSCGDQGRRSTGTASNVL